MRIIRTSEFLKQSREAVESVMGGGTELGDSFLLVANERWVDKSYVIIDPKVLASLLDILGLTFMSKNILSSIEEVRAKASEMQRKRNPYYKGD